MNKTDYFLGLDFGTSGCRACLIDQRNQIIAFYTCSIDEPDKPELWLQCACELIRKCTNKHSEGVIQTIAIDGTSASLLLTDSNAQAISKTLMYNNAIATKQASLIQQLAPANTAVHGASSSLAKLLYLFERHPQASYVMHQADWLFTQLTDRPGISDYNNCLKLGFDPVNLNWPHWLHRLNTPMHLLPQVFAPGTQATAINPQLARELGLSTDTHLVCGTTDSTAAVWASGITQPGEAMTSLGSTLVIKIISTQCINQPEFGIYTHRFKNNYLVGGASNSGCAILRHYFTDSELQQLSTKLNLHQLTNLDYYPLLTPGERFPINNPQLQPRLTPRPAQPARFLQAILEGISAIEAQAYSKLTEFGAPKVRRIVTTGGGSRNQYWTKLRQQTLGIGVETAPQQHAAFGSALIAKSGYDKM